MQDDKLRNISYKSHYWRYVNAFVGAIAGVIGLVYLFFDDTSKTARVWHNIQAAIVQPAVATSPGLWSDSPLVMAAASTKGPALRLSAGAGDYHLGDRFDYRFSATEDGYVSLWNITASGRAQRIIPTATNRRALRIIGGQAYDSGRDGLPTLMVSGAAGVEQLLLLWCPRRDGHGFSALFPSQGSFERDIQKRRAAGCVEHRVSYRIRSGSTP